MENYTIMLLDTYEINSIKFGVYSSKEILKMSVAELTCCKKNGYNSIYDPRLGAIGTSLCETCGQDAIDCPGHFGHVNLNVPVIHPLFVKKTIAFLRCQCIECKRLLFEEEHLILAGIEGNQDQGSGGVEKRFKKIVKMATKMDLCSRCLTPQPTYKQNIGESSISMTILDEQKKKISIELTSRQLLSRLDGLSDESVKLLGFDPQSVHPRNFIIVHLPVLPPSCRPYVKAAGNLCDDDLSNQYVEIIKANNKLSPSMELAPCKRNKVIQTLRFRIHTTFNNSAGKAKHTTNGRPVKCIKSRISGKDGQMRGNIMGRRADQTARTVIGPATTVKNDEMLVPEHIAEILTVPVRVFDLNLEELEKIVNSDKARFVLKQKNGKTIRINLDHALRNRGTPVTKDDVVVDERGRRFVIGAGSEQSADRVANGPRPGDRIFRKMEEISVVHRSRRYYNLEVGDIVERRLVDGDFVLLNRQPTLHKASMQAFKIIIHPGKSFRFNLACTKAFNADFDGDEMNIHVPQSLEAQAEIKFLSTVQNNFINCQSSKLNLVIVQDGILGLFLMTKRDSIELSREQFFQCSMRLSLSSQKVLDRMKEIEKSLSEWKKQGKITRTKLLSGRGLVSLLLPDSFDYDRPIGKEPFEKNLVIKNGVLMQGCLGKSAVGAAHHCIPHYVLNEYGLDVAMNLINDLQFVANAWLEISSFSIGIKDCLAEEKTKVTVKGAIHKSFMEANANARGTRNELIRESRVNASLGKAKDVGLRIAKEALKTNNNFIQTVTSGSKGDFFNIAQITGLLGQQNLSGKRLPLFLNNGTRTIPHYHKNPDDLTISEKYESRGFIESSFIGGLNPREFFFHACSGREGMSDTAVGTAISGYIQRRIVKLQEDIKINYDGSVRDETNRLFLPRYGDHGYDPARTLKSQKHKDQTFMDMQRIARRLNNEIKI